MCEEPDLSVLQPKVLQDTAAMEPPSCLRRRTSWQPAAALNSRLRTPEIQQTVANYHRPACNVRPLVRPLVQTCNQEIKYFPMNRPNVTRTI